MSDDVCDQIFYEITTVLFLNIVSTDAVHVCTCSNVTVDLSIFIPLLDQIFIFFGLVLSLVY